MKEEIKMGLLRQEYGLGYIKNNKQHQVVCYSNILTKLIQDAGRLCNIYTSDLFIYWQRNIVKPLEKGKLRSQTYTIEFRQNGVEMYTEEDYKNSKSLLSKQSILKTLTLNIECEPPEYETDEAYEIRMFLYGEER